MKKLKKSSNKLICGVCAGFAEYFGIDPTVVCIIWAILTFAFGLSIWAYIVAALIMPRDDSMTL